MKYFTIILLTAFTSFSSFSQELLPGYAQPGFYGRLSAGLLTGLITSPSIMISNGYRFRKNAELGIGLGYERYINGQFAPITIESRYNFGQRRTQPFMGITASYHVPLNSYSNMYFMGGLSGGVSIGLSHFFTEHFGLTSAIGYRWIYIESDHDYYEEYLGTSVMSYETNRLEIRMGIIFR